MTTDDFDYWHPIMYRPIPHEVSIIGSNRSGMTASATQEVLRCQSQEPVDTADTPLKRKRRNLFNAAIASIGFTSIPTSRNRKG